MNLLNIHNRQRINHDHQQENKNLQPQLTLHPQIKPWEQTNLFLLLHRQKPAHDLQKLLWLLKLRHMTRFRKPDPLHLLNAVEEWLYSTVLVAVIFPI